MSDKRKEPWNMFPCLLCLPLLNIIQIINHLLELKLVLLSPLCSRIHLSFSFLARISLNHHLCLHLLLLLLLLCKLAFIVRIILRRLHWIIIWLFSSKVGIVLSRQCRIILLRLSLLTSIICSILRW